MQAHIKRSSIGLFGWLVALAVLTSTAEAIVINQVVAPPNMGRPVNGVLYTFPVVINVTTQAADMGGGQLPLIFRDLLGGWGIPSTDFVDGVDLVVPAGLAAGTRGQWRFNMVVGCRPRPEVFGTHPQGIGTGQNVVLGEFVFPTLGRQAFGISRVECLVPGPGPAQPYNDPPEEISEIDRPSPSPQYPRGLVPPQYLLERLPAGGYTVIDLGPLSSTSRASNALGINADGVVVGYSGLESLEEGSDARACIWAAPDYQATDLGLPPGPGPTYSIGTAINDDGIVVGYASIGRDPMQYDMIRGFINAQGNWTIIPPLPGDRASYAQAINSAGHVAGYSTGSGNQSAFLYTGTVCPIRSPAGGLDLAYGLSDEDTVVGLARAPSGYSRAAYAVGCATLIDLMPTTSGHSTVYAVTQNGDMLVGSAGGGGYSTASAVAWLPDGAGGYAMTTMGAFSWPGARALAVNSSHVAVGTSTAGEFRTVAFRWDAGRGMQDLNTLIPRDSGWVLYEATGINDDGLICGNGFINGELHGFLLMP